MITVYAVGTIAPGKTGPAVELMKKVKAYFDKNFPNDSRKLQRPVTGDGGKIILRADWDSLAAWEAVRTKSRSDAGFGAMLKEAEEGMYFSELETLVDQDVG